MEHYKNIVIGFGKGGKTLTKAFAKHGETTALIEESPHMYGGTCPNVGCIPSKFLIMRSERGQPFVEAIAEKKELTARAAERNFAFLSKDPTTTVITGKARFLSDTEVEIHEGTGGASGSSSGGVGNTSGTGTRRITGERIFIATGSTPVVPEFPGHSQNIITSKEAMELETLPQRLVIVGAGFIGLEFASMFARFGAKVTVIDTQPEFLPRLDDDVSGAVLQNLRDMGIEFRLGAEIVSINDTGIKDTNGKTTVSFKDSHGEQKIAADKVLAAVGRKPNTAGLGLENTSVEVTERGAVKVDERLRTTAPNIRAMGDVRGGPMFTYIPLDDFRIITNNLYGDASRTLREQQPLPASVFITPPLSTVGLTEKDARKQGIGYKLFQLETRFTPRGLVLDEPKGFFKVLTAPETSEILGACIYTESSHEVINLVALAMKARLPYTALRDLICTHPTICEGFYDLFK